MQVEERAFSRYGGEAGLNAEFDKRGAARTARRTKQFRGEMEKLRETIKVSAFSRGFKITMDSYFHKVLEHVNLADFFEGGN